MVKGAQSGTGTYPHGLDANGTILSVDRVRGCCHWSSPSPYTAFDVLERAGQWNESR